MVATFIFSFYFLIPARPGSIPSPLTTGLSTRVIICLAPAFSALSLEPESSSTTGKRWTTLHLKQSTTEKTPWALPFVENKKWRGGRDKRNRKGLSFNAGINLCFIFLRNQRQILRLFHFSFCLGKASTGKKTGARRRFFPQVLCK